MSRIIAIDFDGTIVEDAYPDVGRPMPGALETIRMLIENGDKLILWTCRENADLKRAVDFLAQHKIVFEAVNQSHPKCDYAHLPLGRKAYAHLYIDDKMFGGFPGWDKIRKHLFPAKKNEVKSIAKTILPPEILKPEDAAIYVRHELARMKAKEIQTSMISQMQLLNKKDKAA